MARQCTSGVAGFYVNLLGPDLGVFTRSVELYFLEPHIWTIPPAQALQRVGDYTLL